MPDYRISITTKVPAIEVHQQPTAMHEVVTERLVRAKNEERAIAHVVKDTVQIERASADDLIRLTKAGVDIELAEDAA